MSVARIRERAPRQERAWLEMSVRHNSDSAAYRSRQSFAVQHERSPDPIRMQIELRKYVERRTDRRCKVSLAKTFANLPSADCDGQGSAPAIACRGHG